MSKFFASSVQVIVTCGLCYVLGFGQTMVEASGFALPVYSAAGLGTANAIVANTEEPGAFAYNPAAMSFHDNSRIAVGGLFYGPNLSVDTASGSHSSEGANWLITPVFQAAIKVDERWWLGLGVNAPFGLETRWRVGTFPTLSTPIPTPIPGFVLPAGLDHPTQSKLEVIAMVPTATYKINDNISLAVGIDYFNARNATLSTSVTDLDGNGDGWGWNASALYRTGPLSIGAVYHSAATIGIEGNVRSSFPMPTSIGAKVDLNLPWRLRLGVRYTVNEQLALEFDWGRTGWSEFEKLSIKSEATGAIIQRDPNNWEDANDYGMSVTYAVVPATQLRFGYAFDETGQADPYFTPRIPDNDRHLFSVGIGQALAQGWALDAAYTYARFEDRKYRSDRPYVPTESINGTAAVNGEYQLSAHIFALEVSKTF